MIIHGQLFDFKTKRSLADFTVNQHSNEKIDYDDLSSQTEDVVSSNSMSMDSAVKLK